MAFEGTGPRSDNCGFQNSFHNQCVHCFSDTRNGESAFGFSVGIVVRGSTVMITSGTCIWDGEAVETPGGRLRHSLPLSLENNQLHWK